MIAKDVANLIATLRLSEPRPIAIWFIDRSTMYYELLKARDPQGEYAVKHICHRLTFYGIPIRQFSPQYAAEEEFENRPPFCSFPGVWVEMSDGKHLRLEDDLP